MSLWDKLSELDAASDQFAESIKTDKSLEESEIDQILEAICARCVFDFSSPALTGYLGQPWAAVSSAEAAPKLWKAFALPFRELVTALIPEELPLAYFSLILDYDKFLVRPKQDNTDVRKSFSFAAFDHDPDLARDVISGYVGENGISTAEVLNETKDANRKPIVIQWQLNTASTPPNLWNDTNSNYHELNFAGEEPVLQNGNWEDSALKSALLSHPGITEENFAAQVAARYANTIKGYRSHVQHRRNKHSELRGYCTSLFGVFIPATTAKDARAAVFFLFDNTEGIESKNVHLTERLLFISRCLQGYFNDWQKQLREIFGYYKGDELINTTIGALVEAYTIANIPATTAIEHNFCGHNHVEDNLNIYRNILKTGTGSDVWGDFAASDLKALFKISSTDPARRVWPKIGFCDYDSTQRRFTATPISVIFFTSLMRHLVGVENVKIMPQTVTCGEEERNIETTELRLPSMPALPFLLALRVLVNYMGTTIRDADSEVIVHAGKWGGRLVIPLNPPPSGQPALGAKWKSKSLIENRSVEGVCGHIRLVLYAGIGLHKLKAQDDASKGHYPSALLKLFDERDSAICAVYFGENDIQFTWS